MEVMTRMIQRTGRCPLPIHDSFLVADIDTESLRQTMKEVARHHGLRLKVKESKAISTTIEDLIDTHSPLVHPQHHCPGTPTSQLHQPTPPDPSSIQRPQPEVLSARYTPICPTPGIQLEVTTPDLQGQKRPNGSMNPFTRVGSVKSTPLPPRPTPHRLSGHNWQGSCNHAIGLPIRCRHWCTRPAPGPSTTWPNDVPARRDSLNSPTTNP